MRIAYCTNLRLPSERAHGHQVAQVCDALVKLGHDVTVFAARRENTIDQEFAEFYGVSPDIAVRQIGYAYILPNWPPLRLFRLAIMNAGLRIAYRREIASSSFDLLYTRTPALLSALLPSGVPVILEIHQLPRRGRRRFVQLCNRCRKVVCLTPMQREELVTWGVSPEVLMVEGDAVDPVPFASMPEQHAARERFAISSEDFVIGYAGQLSSIGLSKGLPELLAGLRVLHERGVPFTALIAGGPQAAIDTLTRSLGPGLADHVQFVGHLPRRDVLSVYAAADVLVYPAPASNHPFYQRDTSPLKIFEYMASGRPIVAADLPTVRSILTEDIATLCAPGDAASLAEALAWVQANRKDANEKAEKARQIVGQHTWEKRMQRILSLLGGDQGKGVSA